MDELEETRMENLKGSLPVPSVQEMVTQGVAKVPPRYLRDDICTVGSDAEVPLIDMSMLMDPQTHHIELHKLHAACNNWGVFQLINHGVETQTITDILRKARQFFGLPLQQKKQWAQKAGQLEGYGQAFVTSEHQKLEWNDMIFLNTLPLHTRNLSFWPQTPSDFGEVLERYSEQVRELASSVVGLMAKGLGIEQQQLSKAFLDGSYAVRFNHYPPCPEPDRVLGLSPHADISGITLLLDGGDLPGLQVLKDGEWVGVQPTAGAFIVNIGQIIEVMSNGVYKAPDHRAMVNKMRERVSIATFCYPASSLDIGPKLRTPHLYKTLTLDHYFHCFFNIKLDDSFIDALKL